MLRNMSQRLMFAMASVGFLAILWADSMPVVAQTGILKHPLITQRVDEQKLVTLYGSTRPEVNANDRGPVADNLLLHHMYLQLRRTPEQQKLWKT